MLVETVPKKIRLDRGLTFVTASTDWHCRRITAGMAFEPRLAPDNEHAIAARVSASPPHRRASSNVRTKAFSVCKTDQNRRQTFTKRI